MVIIKKLLKGKIAEDIQKEFETMMKQNKRCPKDSYEQGTFKCDPAMSEAQRAEKKERVTKAKQEFKKQVDASKMDDRTLREKSVASAKGLLGRLADKYAAVDKEYKKTASSMKNPESPRNKKQLRDLDRKRKDLGKQMDQVQKVLDRETGKSKPSAKKEKGGKALQKAVRDSLMAEDKAENTPKSLSKDPETQAAQRIKEKEDDLDKLAKSEAEADRAERAYEAIKGQKKEKSTMDPVEAARRLQELHPMKLDPDLIMDKDLRDKVLSALDKFGGSGYSVKKMNIKKIEDANKELRTLSKQAGDPNIDYEKFKRALDDLVPDDGIDPIHERILEDANYHTLNKALSELGKFKDGSYSDKDKSATDATEKKWNAYTKKSGRTWDM